MNRKNVKKFRISINSRAKSTTKFEESIQNFLQCLERTMNPQMLKKYLTFTQHDSQSPKKHSNHLRLTDLIAIQESTSYPRQMPFTIFFIVKELKSPCLKNQFETFSSLLTQTITSESLAYLIHFPESRFVIQEAELNSFRRTLGTSQTIHH